MQNKIVVLISLALILGSCSLFIPEVVSVEHFETSDGIIWKLAKYDSLREHPRNYQMIYVGTYSDHHLIYNQSKMDGPDHYALKRNDYKPYYEFSYAGMKNHRNWQFLFRNK
jgi:hypothetical protein